MIDDDSILGFVSGSLRFESPPPPLRVCMFQIWGVAFPVAHRVL